MITTIFTQRAQPYHIGRAFVTWEEWKLSGASRCFLVLELEATGLLFSHILLLCCLLFLPQRNAFVVFKHESVFFFNVLLIKSIIHICRARGEFIVWIHNTLDLKCPFYISLILFCCLSSFCIWMLSPVWIIFVF